MSPDDSADLEQRAEAQLELARNAKDPRAVKVHYELANHYLDRLYGEADEAARDGSGSEPSLPSEGN